MSITATISGGLVQLSGNPVWVHCTGAVIPAGASEYKILLQLVSEDGKLEGSPFTPDGKAPDANGEAWFDISGLVDQPVKAVFQYPPSGAVVTYPTQAYNVTVMPGERYIDTTGTLVENWGTVSSVFQILKGGLSPREIAAMNATGDTFYSFYLQDGKFLTARPWGDEVHPTQPVKLWFMAVANSTADFNVKATYNDASEQTYTKSIAFDTDNLYEFNCNPELHGIPMETAGKKIDHFDVWITGLSETLRFTVDWKYCERPFFLLFANTFGGVDDIYLGGFGKDKFTTEGEVNYKPQERGATIYEPTLLSSDKSGQNKWTINTGWKELTAIQYYRDLLVSKQAWFLYPNLTISHYVVIPIIVESTDKLLLDRSKDLFSIDIEFSEAHKSKFSFDNRSF